MSEIKRDILVGLLFISGIFGFLSGEFIVSTLVFAAASLFSNLDKRPEQSC
ncbi:hypothetical protein [Methylomarinum vadi]|uniref:hypothetical protein n=1 Tax=Methylomarinum vadi TaxID=438855 RepID=UPI00190F7A6C|nr:hypothetical protein [Methylomarinum vadi]